VILYTISIYIYNNLVNFRYWR